MSREALLDRILYSHYLEKMFSIVTGRLDNTLSCLLFLLGSSVIAETGNSVVTGLFIAAISAIQVTFRFGKTAEHSRKQSVEYQKLFTTEKSFSDTALKRQLLKIEDNDYPPWGILSRPALLRASIRRGIPAEEGPEFSLSKTEKIFAILAGDLPRQ